MKKLFIILLCFFCTLTDLKLGNVQPVEIFMFILLPAVALKIFSELKIESTPPVIALLKKYAFVIFCVSALSIFSMRLPIFLPGDISFLRTPPFLGISKILQLIFVMTTMFVLIFWFVRHPKLTVYFARYYVYAGLFSALFALISFIAMYGGFKLGGAYAIEGPRAKGFFVEGGPFGLYLVSVAMVIWFRIKYLRDGKKMVMYLHLGIVILAFFAASSKAGILLALFLFVYFQIMQKRLKYMMFFVALSVPFLILSGQVGAISAYVTNYNNFTETAVKFSDDNNLIMGRIMAAVLVPRMILDHPISGIGLGNYSLQRNNPYYLQGLPTTEYWDLPGLGLPAYAAELGLPLTFFLMWLIWHPVSYMRKRRMPMPLILLASYPFFAFLLGVQITFIYPWLVSALALGLAFSEGDVRRVDSATALPAYA